MDRFNELLIADQATELTERAISYICDLAVANNLQFSQSPEGIYLVEAARNVIEAAPTQQEPESVRSSFSQEIPPHDERFVTVQLNADGAEFRYVAVRDVDNFGRLNGLNLQTLRSTFESVLRWTQPEHVVKEKTPYQSHDNLGFNRIGFRLDALPLVLRAVKKTDPNAIYAGYAVKPRAKREKYKELFIAFSETVLTPSEE